MAKRFICRPFFVRRPDGKIAATYDEPPDDAEFAEEGCPEVVGPAPLQLPAGPMDPEDFERWREGQRSPVGPFRFICVKRPFGALAVEEADVPDPGDLATRFEVHTTASG